MGETKTVLDTNLLISSVGWEGSPRKIFSKCEKGDVDLIMSLEQFDEVCRVLDYPKFDFSDEQKNKFKNLVLEVATFVQPKEKVNIIKDDPEDNMILETALAGNADYIVTGDSHLLELKEFRGIKIMKAREFIEKFEG